MGENLTAEFLEGSEPELEVAERSIYFSRPTTVFAAVAASIFTIIGVLGRKFSILDTRFHSMISTNYIFAPL